ncbi:MAG: DUF2892 domain-containing protein [Methylocystis sp.]|nr:DUF2892 domain-containing protein [Methylocystis sp.]
MTKNVGQFDRMVRVALALAIAVAYAFDLISGTVAIALGVVAAVLIVTSATSTCPAYSLLGVSTCDRG